MQADPYRAVPTSPGHELTALDSTRGSTSWQHRSDPVTQRYEDGRRHPDSDSEGPKKGHGTSKQWAWGVDTWTVELGATLLSLAALAAGFGLLCRWNGRPLDE